MDARIPLGVHIPQADVYTPYDAQRKQHSLRQMAQQTKLQDARIREEEDQARMRDEDRQDDALIQQAFLEHGGDHEKMRAAIAPKVKGRSLQRWDADHLKQQQAMTALQREKQIALQTSNLLVGSTAAGLLQLPYEQRKAQLPAALKRLQDGGIDTAPFAQFDPTDESLKSVAASSNYLGQLLSFSEKQSLEEKRKADAAKAEQQTKNLELEEGEKQKSRLREQVARAHLTVLTPEQHQAWFSSIPKEIASEYANLKDFSKSAGRVIQQMALSAQQRTTDENTDATRTQRAEVDAARNQIQRDTLDLRRDIADTTAKLREIGLEISRTRAENAGARGGLSATGLKTEERAIANIENTLNQKRITLGKQLQTKRNAKNEDLDEKGVAQVEAQLAAATDSLQNTQFRKARLYDIAVPDVAMIDSAGEKQEIEAPDGSVWTKKGGVAFFTRMAGQQPAAAAPAAPTAPVAAPKSGAAPAQPPARPSGAAAATHQRPTAARAAAPQQYQVGQKFSNGSQTVQWDGKQFIDLATGKPAVFGK